MQMLWLVGNKGMLGYEVEELLKSHNLSYIATDYEVDITDYKLLNDFIADKKVDLIINCAAYTKVDKAEEEIEKAYAINRDGVRNLARIALAKEARLIHISTDYVFDGQKKKEKEKEKDRMGVCAYLEEDSPNPLSVYGKSKLAGEEELKRGLEAYFIIRTAWLYGKKGANFVYTMLKLFQERDLVKVVDDQWGSPTYARDLAEVIIKIIESGSKQYGIYHFTNEGVTNWYQFAREIYEQAKGQGLIEEERKVKIIPIKTEEYPTAARRPKYSVLSKEKIKKELNIKIPYWRESLEKCLKRILDEGYRI